MCTAAARRGPRPARLTLAAAWLLAPAAGVALDDPGEACRVHVAREVAIPGPAGTTSITASLRELCDVTLYRPAGHFDPCAQYPQVPGCDGAPACEAGGSVPDWPLCTGTVQDPDLGYRYPLVDTATSFPRDVQDPALDSWPVCASPDLSVIASDPGISSCAGELEELGRCRASAHTFEKIATSTQGARPAAVFYSFTPTHADCDACAHDAFSAVEGCKALCDRYFGALGFDQLAGPDGRWRDAGDPAWSERPPGLDFESVGLRHHVLAGSTPHTGKTPLEACRDVCGPPTDSCAAAAPGGSCVPQAHLAPPWVSSRLQNAREPEEKENHWHFVQFGRGWDPNDNLDNWLRSYTVNKDKPWAPSNRCDLITGQYCDEIIPLAGGGAAKRAACKATALPEDVDLDGDGMPDGPVLFDLAGEWTAAEDGFCVAWWRGFPLCADSCYSWTNDGKFNPDHLCHGEALGGIAGGVAGAPACHEVTATCLPCRDATGEPRECHRATLVRPGRAPDGAPSRVGSDAVALTATLRTPGGAPVPEAEVVGAHWDNLSTGASGALVATAGSWRSDAPVPLDPARINQVRVRFLDTHDNLATDRVELSVAPPVPVAGLAGAALLATALVWAARRALR